MGSTHLSVLLVLFWGGPLWAQDDRQTEKTDDRRSFWVDLLFAEPLENPEELWMDLASVDVLYLGETHRLERHHRLHEEIIREMGKTDRPLLIGMEQIEAKDQPAVDRFNAGELSFEELAEAISWKEQWRNYPDYRGIVEAAQEFGARLVGINAPRQLIREVGQQGVAALPPEKRSQLPERLHLDDPTYEKLMDKLLSVHSTFDPKFLRNVFEAQAARDDSFAHHFVVAMNQMPKKKGAGRPLGILIAGSGHLQFGLGTPDRVRWREPNWESRILLFSESGDLVLTPMEKAMRRAIQIHHRELRYIQRPVADYLHVREWNPNADRDVPDTP
ncbi:MAG: ChaN family lipoprotein [Verrucomicrobiota bacterium]